MSARPGRLKTDTAGLRRGSAEIGVSASKKYGLQYSDIQRSLIVNSPHVALDCEQSSRRAWHDLIRIIEIVGYVFHHARSLGFRPNNRACLF